MHVTRGTRLLGESHAEMLTAVRMLEHQNSEQASKVLEVRRDLRVQSMQLEEL